MAEYVVEFGKDGRPVEPDGRLDAAAFHRNHQPIWAVLEQLLAGQIRRRAGGRQRHRPACGVFCAANAPTSSGGRAISTRQHLKSIAAWRSPCEAGECPRAPAHRSLRSRLVRRDAGAPAVRAQLLAVFCANVIHIAPWRVAEGLFAGAGHALCAGRAAVSLRAVQARRQAHRALQRGLRLQPARGQSRMGRARHRRSRDAGGRCRPRPTRDGGDARQQHDPVFARRKAG